jgi:integrase
MAILAECPTCHNKQSTRNKLCSGKNGCGLDLDKAKRSKKVKYWIQYRLPGGKQRKEFVSYSIEEARDADGKRRVQKRENRIFDMLPEANMTFNELAEWYLNLKSVKRLASHKRVVWCIDTFNEVFGNQRVSEIKPVRLEEFQDKCEDEGLAPATIDLILTIVGTAVRKAWDNDMVNGRAVKTFRRVKAKLKKGANARERTLTISEHLALVEVAPAHLKALLITAFNTGMRQGEMLKLKWSHIERGAGFIRLPAEITKEGKAKSIPLNKHVRKVLERLPRAMHHDHVFTYQGNPIKVGITFAFKSACKTAGIPYGQKVENGVRFHDIRTTVKTNMLRAGLSKTVRDTILGHSLQGMDVYYIKLSDNDLKAEMDKYTAWLDAQIANVTQSVTQEANSG